MTNAIQQKKYDQCDVLVYANAVALGEAAAKYTAQRIQSTIDAQGQARVIFATGASQFEFLQALVKHSIAWDKVDAFHLDEYLGIADDHPASFRLYLKQRLFDLVKPRTVNLLNGTADDPEAECARYSELLLQDEIDLACIGIGENGHIAFNDPPVADFHDPKMVKVVELDEACRRQQHGEGWFPTLNDVPTHALTLTVTAILRSKAISCVVPDERKAPAVKAALSGPVETACPASILRSHANVNLWLDQPASSLL
ncbi:MAG: glucosamine-6-phosphate deaminase [Candidatus Hinthialibacter antarcticus]|nr:glucosamine-6-phosphate deaminase [Candidatus Hinthialibacter antarcticus]